MVQDAVLVELGFGLLVEHRTTLEVGGADAQLGVVDRHPQPVLEAVLRHRRQNAVVDEEQSRQIALLEPLAPLVLVGPTNQCHLHRQRTVRSACCTTVSWM